MTFQDLFVNKIILAPMAGVSEPVFRGLCREMGADLVVTEMISAEGLFYDSDKTKTMAKLYPEDAPAGIQLFGSDPQKLADACQALHEMFKPAYIDLNCGCPVKKVVGKNGGSALLKEPQLFEKIISAMSSSVPIPVTVKIRSGWTWDEPVDVEFAKRAEACGAAAVALHPRSRSQGYSGEAQWDRIRLVKQAISIPLIGNGDITSAQRAKEMIEQTGCDSIMVGRITYGNPWIFSEIKAHLQNRPAPQHTLLDRVEMAKRHYTLYENHYGEKKAVKDMKQHLAWYIKGFPAAAKLRDSLFRAASKDETFDILNMVQTDLKGL